MNWLGFYQLAYEDGLAVPEINVSALPIRTRRKGTMK